MKTNTELLMMALGWQGGTVHQVAHETGLAVSQVLDLHDVTITYNTPRRWGRIDAERGDVKRLYQSRREEFTTDATLISYWFGVLQGMKEKEK